MPNPTRLLRRGPQIDEAEIEAARSLTLARLSAIFDPGTANPEPAEPVESVDDVAADKAVLTEAPTVPTEAPTVPTEAPTVPTEAFAAHDATGTGPGAEPGLDRNGHGAPDLIAATPPIIVIGDWDEANGIVAARLDPDAPMAPQATGVPVMADRGSISTDPDGWDLPVAEVHEAASPLSTDAPAVRDEPSGARRASPLGSPPRVVRLAASRPRPAAPPRPSAKPTAVPVAVIASCPYCAILLQPPPEADRRCARCRQRIVVKRLQGRAVYLTEAAVQVFEAERRRIANTGRWTRDRERWLKLAASVGSPAGRIARLGRAVLSDEVVADARALYETTVERLVRAAKRDHLWDDAARLRRDQALSLYRVAGSPVPPPDDVAALHREGALAALRGLGEIAKEAELTGADCCDSCRADHGRHFRISRELREPRLPHAGCPKGLCRCRWELTARDRNLIGGYLRRHARPERVAPSD